jgi:hypothetical protein
MTTITQLIDAITEQVLQTVFPVSARRPKSPLRPLVRQGVEAGLRQAGEQGLNTAAVIQPIK